MGKLDIESEIKKASRLMTAHGMNVDEQAVLAQILIGLGVEKCLLEQERIQLAKNVVIDRAQKGLVH